MGWRLFYRPAAFSSRLQRRVIGVTLGTGGVVGALVGCVHGSTRFHTRGEVGVGEEAVAKGHGVKLAFGGGGLGLVWGVAHVANQNAFVMGTGKGHHICFLQAKKVCPHDVQVGQVKAVELLGQVGYQSQRVAVFHVVVAVQGRQAQAHAVAADGGTHSGQDFKEEAYALLKRAAVTVAALVGAVAQNWSIK